MFLSIKQCDSLIRRGAEELKENKDTRRNIANRIVAAIEKRDAADSFKQFLLRKQLTFAYLEEKYSPEEIDIIVELFKIY